MIIVVAPLAIAVLFIGITLFVLKRSAGKKRDNASDISARPRN
jgi:hypothetical protein